MGGRYKNGLAWGEMISPPEIRVDVLKPPHKKPSKSLFLKLGPTLLPVSGFFLLLFFFEVLEFRHPISLHLRTSFWLRNPGSLVENLHFKKFTSR